MYGQKDDLFNKSLLKLREKVEYIILRNFLFIRKYDFYLFIFIFGIPQLEFKHHKNKILFVVFIALSPGPGYRAGALNIFFSHWLK